MVNIRFAVDNDTLVKNIHKLQGVFGGSVAVSGKIGSSILRPSV
jgi:hypothetical protein